jgi:3-methyladenine DNA glycosylase AlkD
MTLTAAISSLKKRSTPKYRAGMARYGLPMDKAFGVPVGDIQTLGKQIGKNHALALALAKSKWYEARMLACFVVDPGRLTSAEMDGWCRAFDSWGIVDTACFVAFDKSPLAWKKVSAWAKLKGEFQRRTGFALLASLALHQKKAPDAPFIKALALCEKHASDGRNFVKKGVSWAIRTIGHRSVDAHAAAVESATRLAASANAIERWIGKDVLRDLNRPAVSARLKKRATTMERAAKARA